MPRDEVGQVGRIGVEGGDDGHPVAEGTERGQMGVVRDAPGADDRDADRAGRTERSHVRPPNVSGLLSVERRGNYPRFG
jgi:hypothetical protein